MLLEKPAKGLSAPIKEESCVRQAVQPVGRSSETRSRAFPRLKQLIPWVLMLGVIVLMARLIDVRATLAALSRLTPQAVIFTTVLFLLDRFSMSFKWNILLRSRGYWLSHWDAFRLYLASGFVGYAIPATVGGDIFRAARLAVAGQSASGVSATIVLERVLGLLAILTLSCIGLVCSVLTGRSDLLALLGAVFLALLAGSALTAVSMSERLYQFLKKATHRIRGNRVSRMLHSLHDEYVALSKNVRPLVWFFVLSLVNQLIRTLMCVPLLTSLDIDVNLLALFALLPLSKAFIQFMPVPAGIGVAEGATVAALTLAHVSPAQALLVALVLRAVELITLVPSGLAYMVDVWYLRKSA